MDNEFNTAKKFPVYEQKEKSRRWSNCFGLVNKFKRLKNRLSTIQANDALRQPIPSSQQKSTRTLSNGMLVQLTTDWGTGVGPCLLTFFF
jgi:hypothetical protein